ncbi:ATP-binding cassette domain-containing protein [Mucilaginibacter robiniae]|uniref:ATP-binding cassette domain-containing protein n=1 Tax=Mucilaginibacter robiniae TaxID=2728022 RepID=A0A7L5E6W8_9SPHI|nr:ATP-binding cassette domain-containing protein [Mucilaginibacter robiniae]QJD98137.1 ATP-binding cassette domain-containing protein [Mucilaginibacter robiniae]
MIELQQVNKTFNKGKANQVNAIVDLNLHIADQQYVVIVGANGSGKSTLLNLIAGSVLSNSGHIVIDGVSVTKLPDYQRSRWIARVFQNPLSGTAPDLSILDNFRLAALRTHTKRLRIGTSEGFKKQVQEKISLLGMGLENKLEQQPMGTLSGGQRQALTLLMSVMDDCKILLLDEPTAALDPRSAELVMHTADELIKSFNLTAILITHQLKDAYRYGNRLIQMEEGKIIRDYNKENKLILTQSDLFDWFS